MTPILRNSLPKTLFTTLLIVAIFFCVHISADNRKVSNLNVGTGLSQMSIMKIYQDSKGYIWFGTRNGLNKYDGVTMKVYKPARGDRRTSLIDMQISALMEDGEGHLWIGTSRGLSRLNLATDEIVSYGAPEYPWLASGVRSLFKDSRGRMWVGSARGLYLFEPKSEMGQPISLGGELQSEPVTVIAEDAEGNILVGTERKGVFVCDPSMKKLFHFSDDNILANNNVTDIIIDTERGYLWIATAGGGIAKIDPKTSTHKLFNHLNSALTTDNIRVLESDGNTILVGTFDGLYSIDSETDKLSLYAKADSRDGQLSHFSIYSLCIDRSGGVWVGTYSGGADYLSPYNNRFTLHETPIGINEDMSGVFGPLVDMGDGLLYVSTEGGGLLEYNKANGQSTYRPYDTSYSSQNNHNIIKSLMPKGDALLCGTTEGTVYSFDRRTKKFTLLYSLPERSSVYSILQGSDSCIWMATSKPIYGLVRVTPDGKMQTEFEANDTIWRPGSGRCLLEIAPGVILVGTRNNGLYRFDYKAKKYQNFTPEGSGTDFLPSNYVTSIIRDRKGRIWVGTIGGGLNQYEDGKGIINSISASEGLGEDDISMIVEGEDGRIWLSGSSSIISFDPDTHAIHNYAVSDDLGAQEFSPHSGVLLANGDVAFSSGKGFVTFSPSEIKENSYQPPIVFTGLEVNNEKIVPGDGSILSVELDDTPRVKLKYNQNNIVISYAALNYVHSEQNLYAVRLKGYDNDWQDVGHRRSAYYTNLKPGHYTFEVKAANNDGVWSDEIRSIEIVVSPPIWATWYAWLLYAILFFGTIILIGYYIIKKKALEEKVKYQKLEQERSEEFHRTKLQMFTNFSHELRTPLTLIISPLEELLHVAEFNHGVKNKLSLIYNNSQRMLMLVNQLMDLRKTQAGKMQLKVSKEDMCSFLQEMFIAFNHLAEGKNIRFTFESSEERMPAWFDKSLCDKVLFNLLSNAFKFTRPSDRVTMSLQKLDGEELSAVSDKLGDAMHQDSKYVKITVSDTGCGIPKDELERIFDPFYQVDNGETANSKGTMGTGIGLSLTKMIVELHHGAIWAANNEEGGATFNVVLPIDRQAFSEDEVDAEAADRVVVDVIPSETPESLSFDRRYTVLLVEDNEEVRAYVKECLSPYFDIIEADNGEDAFDLAVERYPGIIVSDIMMPRKNGLDLCAQIKEDLRTEHIPVILMTARSMLQHIKEGFASGADDYIVKPFSMDVLILRMHNILSAREKLKKLYGKKFSLEAMGIKIVSSEDKFTQKFFEIIEANVANPELNIDKICKEMGLSRTNLYRKLKAITDLSPVELIRNKRLEVATRLLLESDYTVSEISTYVGFNSHAYFTQCFKTVYGCSPSEYVAANKKE